MSFLFGSTKNIAADKPALFGAQPERVATNEAARVVPWICGRRFLGVTWMGDVWDVYTTEVERKVGKKNATVGHNYYASFCALVCNGPVDFLYNIYFDEQVVWNGTASRQVAGDEFVSITIPSRGVLHFFWGNDSQTLHPLLEASGLNHSAYRGQCYIIGEGIYFGLDRTSAPNIILDVARYPRPSFVPSPKHFIGTGANPVSVLHEWWTDKRFGLGRSEDELDQSRLLRVAEQLYDEGIGINPLLNTERDFKSALIHLMEYIDAYPTSYDGKFGIDLHRDPELSTEPVAHITSAHMVGDPAIDSETWEDVSDEVRVKFKNINKFGADDVAKHHELASFEITGQHKAQSLDRPWVIEPTVAQTIAQESGRKLGVPRLKGSVSLLESAAINIQVGSLFTMASRDGTLRLRCIERTEPPPDRRVVEIGFESDMAGAVDDLYVPDEDPILSAQSLTPTEPFDVAILDTPYAFAQSALASLTFLVARGDGYTTFFDVWKATTEEGSYVSASSVRAGDLFSRWAVRAELSAEYTADTLPIDDLVGITFEVTSPDADLLDDEWELEDGLNHQLLCFFGDDASEIVSLFDVQKTGATTYTAKCVRGLYDTRRTTHASGTDLWLMARTSVESFGWAPFSASPRYYKIQPIFGTAQVDIAEVDAIEHTENARTLLPICPPNVFVNGDSVSPFWSGSDLTVSWLNTSRARTVFGLPFGDAPPSDLDSVLIQIWVGGELNETFVSVAGPETATIAPTSQTDLTVRLYGVRGGRRSLHYTEVAVGRVD